MFGLSASELGLVLFLFALIFASGKLPRVGEALGEYLAGYRRGMREDDERIEVRAVAKGPESSADGPPKPPPTGSGP